MSTNNNAANIATFMEEVQRTRMEFIQGFAVNFYAKSSDLQSNDYIHLGILAPSQTEYSFSTQSQDEHIKNVFNSIATTFSNIFKKVAKF